jgi:hypothetical protein
LKAGNGRMTGLTLDAGALIALERNDRRVIAALRVAVEAELKITVPAGVVAQVWRDGARQARLARFLGSSAVVVEALDDARARAAGQLCGVAGTRDVIDAAVVLGAKARGDRVFTSDVDDLRALVPSVDLVRL